MSTAKQYQIVIQYGNFDGENCYQSTCIEFPDIFDWADTPTEAYELALDSIEARLEVLDKRNL